MQDLLCDVVERYGPRVRIDQLLNLDGKIMVPLALLNLLIAGFIVTAGLI
jgi:NADH:ubiquinone oxidoreductase subunit H